MTQVYKFIRFSNKFVKQHYYNQCSNIVTKLNFSSKNNPAIILGIETSCDDTGMAIVDSNGKILGEALNSQLHVHLPEGGIDPAVARDLHLQNIESVYQECLKSANIDINNVDAIAITLEPGLPLSLVVGKNFSLKLSSKYNKPIIPVHHMQAHALTARLNEKVNFPFLVLLMSGGHCSIVLAQSVNQFKLLGETIDATPGQCFDKVARRLKLINIFEYSNISGGKAIELAAMKADNPDQFHFPTPLVHFRNCNFSFSCLTSSSTYHIDKEEDKYNIILDEIIPGVNNLCAGLIMATIKHICTRLERAMQFVENEKLIPENNKILIISGGVASNNLIAKALDILCLERGFKLIRTPPNLCTDNGVMIAWNGIEKYMANIEIIRNRDEINKLDIKGKSLIGEDWCDIVKSKNIERYRFKIKFNNLLS
ncbi:PREDICTED: probable tRNA N6-adenosine threonylcarbamoyltransferase, mitochondrial [Ceratosolen solmsi marchali]|uniref:N(6)-L-threonylcarbamoyladenine synthase n=1 Tax=Ceratosolen solmsi marchali TaxID=326594 RepID=A0AAJ6YDK0_9HYME|nr:PREDICTED: probable tRNA N6-adenosine threonylcarbamoyltransferase, mitochondrial [Ceratosolen solmsi marchali]